jgi:sugar/nucleoside kinase (ribokinase family)
MVDEVKRLAARASLVKSSEEDLDGMGLPRTLEALQTLVTRPGAVAVLTLAERGAVAAIGDHVVEVPAPIVDVIDATGAGDAFMGTLLAGLVRCDVRPGRASWTRADTWEPLLALACRVGARAVTAMGATDAVRDLDVERRVLQEMKP